MRRVRLGLLPSSPHSCFSVGPFLILCSSQAPWNPAVDVWWHELMSGASTECEPEWCDAEDELFILYTSGSTGKPKVRFPAQHPVTPQLWELARVMLGGPSEKRNRRDLGKGLCWSFLLRCCSGSGTPGAQLGWEGEGPVGSWP